MSRQFPAKLILLGEYSVLVGSMALAMPFNRYFGRWAVSPPTQSFKKRIHSLFDYLSELSTKDEALSNLNVAQMWEDLDNGLFFSSNIPIGSGLGSSGALTAALFSRYLPIENQEKLRTTPRILRDKLGLIESFFHGFSSGTDPLVSYLNQPILIDGSNDIKSIFLPEDILSNFYILDTQIPRNTESLVKHFNELYKQSAFKSHFDNDYCPLVNQGIKQMIKNHTQAFQESIKEISHYQFHHLSFLIPKESHRLWQQGLVNGDYYMKLCGAGGGGSMLIYCQSKTRISELQQEFDIKSVI